MTQRAIAVVGSGMVGSALALGIARRGLADRLVWVGGEIPRPAEAAGQDARVIACSAASRDLLDELGVWQQLPQERLCAYQKMQVWEQLGTAGLNFRPPDTAETLGWIVENTLLNQCIAEQLIAMDTRVESYLGCQVVGYESGEQQRLQLDSGEWLSVDLVLAADGAFSSLRELSGQPTIQRDTGQRSLVALLSHSEPHGHCAWQNFLTTGPVAFLPLPQSQELHQCAIVWSLDREVADEVEALDDKAFLQRLSRFAPAQLGQLTAAGGRAAFDICQHRLRQYGQPGLLFVGDAAHRVHPLAGQGANLGFADVRCLLGELQRNLERGESPAGASLLRRYQRQRRWHNDLTLDLMTALQLGYGFNEPHWRVARNTAVRLIDSLPPVKRLLARGARGDIA